MLAGQCDGHHEDERRRAHGHAQGRHGSAHLVGAQGVDAHGQDFTEDDATVAG